MIVGFFLREVYRVLEPNGIVRIAVPDIRKKVELYLKDSSPLAADKFIESTGLCDPPRFNRFISLFVKNKNHQWMYDGSSLVSLFQKYGFKCVQVMDPGATNIENYGNLNLNERESESVYLEARKP